MRRTIRLILTLLLLEFAFSKDPFTNREEAVGYIVIDNEGKTERYIVIESGKGKVKILKTDYEPDKVLKKGGQIR